MRGNGLYWATVISAFVHAAFFFLALFILKQSDVHINASVYTVNLVDAMPRRAAEPARAQLKPETKPQAEEKKLEPLEQPPTVSKSAMVYAAQKLKAMEKRLSEEVRAAQRIQEIARQKAEEKDAAKRIAELKSKKRFENIRQSASVKADAEHAVVDSSRAERTLDEYTSKVNDKIKRAWVYPDLGQMAGMEATVSVTVQADGRIIVNRIERTSGNAIFDRSALRAIAKASPVAPPPYAPFELGVRFSPDDK